MDHLLLLQELLMQSRQALLPALAGRISAIFHPSGDSSASLVSCQAKIMSLVVEAAPMEEVVGCMTTGGWLALLRRQIDLQPSVNMRVYQSLWGLFLAMDGRERASDGSSLRHDILAIVTAYVCRDYLGHAAQLDVCAMRSLASSEGLQAVSLRLVGDLASWAERAQCRRDLVRGANQWQAAILAIYGASQAISTADPKVFLDAEWTSLAAASMDLLVAMCLHGMVDEPDGWRVLQDATVTAAVLLPSACVTHEVAAVETRRFELQSAQAVSYSLLHRVLTLVDEQLSCAAGAGAAACFSDNVLALLGHAMDQVFWAGSAGKLGLQGITGSCSAQTPVMSETSPGAQQAENDTPASPTVDEEPPPIGAAGAVDAPAEEGREIGAESSDEMRVAEMSGEGAAAQATTAASTPRAALAKPVPFSDPASALVRRVAGQLVAIFGHLSLRRSIWPRGSASVQHSQGELLASFCRLAIWHLDHCLLFDEDGGTVSEEYMELLRLCLRHPQCAAQTTSFAFVAVVSMLVRCYSSLVGASAAASSTDWEQLLSPMASFVKFAAHGHGIRHYGELCKDMKSLQGTPLLNSTSSCFKPDFSSVALAMHFASQQWDAVLATQGLASVCNSAAEAEHTVDACAASEALLVRQLLADWAAAQLLRPGVSREGAAGVDARRASAEAANPEPDQGVAVAVAEAQPTIGVALRIDTEGLQAAAALAWRRALSILANERGVWADLAPSVSTCLSTHVQYGAGFRSSFVVCAPVRAPFAGSQAHARAYAHAHATTASQRPYPVNTPGFGCA